jgi:triacylglycerol lipase
VRPPVLLIPGWRDDRSVLSPLAAYLLTRGWSEQSVATVSFDDPFGSNIDHAREIDRAIHDLRARARDGEPIVVVAHSMGGLGLRWFLTHHDASGIRLAVFLATPHRGTWMAYLGRGRGATEMRPSSAFLRELNAGATPSHVRCIAFRAPWDTRLLPGSSAWLESMECRTLPALGHRRILRQRSVFDTLVAAIEES